MRHNTKTTAPPKKDRATLLHEKTCLRSRSLKTTRKISVVSVLRQWQSRSPCATSSSCTSYVSPSVQMCMCVQIYVCVRILPSCRCSGFLSPSGGEFVRSAQAEPHMWRTRVRGKMERVVKLKKGPPSLFFWRKPDKLSPPPGGRGTKGGPQTSTGWDAARPA